MIPSHSLSHPGSYSFWDARTARYLPPTSGLSQISVQDAGSDSRHCYGIVLEALRKGKDLGQECENNYMKYGILEGKEGEREGDRLCV